MKADDANLLDLLKVTNQFEVPIYQRAYAWGRAECEQLWADILRAGRSQKLGSHFTGSVVYVEKTSGTNTNRSPNLLIDGQQRVTTVTLILTALAARLAQQPEQDREPVDGFSPKKIRGRYLLNEDEEGERRFKLLLSQGDKDALISAVEGRSPADGETSRVAANLKFFQTKLADEGTELADVCRGLAKLYIVDIRLQVGVDHPQLVFEAMNSTGKKLSQADLIRNYVLMDLPPRDQERLYKQYWRPMELDFGQSAYEALFDEFVRHYLTITTATIPRLGDVYDAFKGHAEGTTSDGETIESLVSEVRDYSRRYCAMALGRERDPDLRAAFKDLDQIRADVVFPFLLEVYSDYELDTISKSEFLEIVKLVTSYVFRRAVVRIPTNSLNTTFATFARSLRKQQYVDSVKAHFITMQGYRRFPTDAEFSRELRTSDLYNFKRRSYFLRLMENYGRKEHVSVEEYTIEHILPQNENLRPEWKEALGPEWPDLQSRYLHTLGNLTLTGYNSEYSDRPFNEKRDMKGGFAESPLRLNRGLGQLRYWNAQTIEDRAARLAEEAVQIWASPTLSPERLAGFDQPRPTTGFSIEDHPNLLRPDARARFNRLRTELLALYPEVSCDFLKHYVAFRAESTFLEVVPRTSRMLLMLRIPFETLTDERGLARDVSNIGHLGTGGTEIALSDDDEFTYVMGLVRQAYEYQSVLD